MSLLRGNPPDAVRVMKQTAYLEGFSLHAGVHLHANDREGLAHLCGYGAARSWRKIASRSFRMAGSPIV
jgi:hypothetical protein